MEEWDTVGLVRDGHYFGEQALFYEAPRLKRYRSIQVCSSTRTIDFPVVR
jgi:hypothetical protein